MTVMGSAAAGRIGQDWRRWPAGAKAVLLERLQGMRRRFDVETFSSVCDFTEAQVRATRTADEHKYTLYGGSRGPGKSHWLRWYLVWRLLRWAEEGHKGVRVGLFCEDYPSLKDRQISKISRWPAWMGYLKSTKVDGMGFFLWPEYGGGGILLRNLNDATKYQSVEFAGVAIDELTRNPERTFDELRGSLRWPGIQDTFFTGATNPNGRFFKWVRRYWVERDLPEHLQEIAGEFAYVKALPMDNPYLTEDYWQMLNTLAPRLQAAWRDGSWYVAVEGLVYETFDERNVTEDGPDMSLPFEIAIDDGYIDPRATLFIQRSGTRILVFDELYHSKKLEEESIREILERCLWWTMELAAETVDEDAMEDEDAVRAMGLPEYAAYLQRIGVRLPELAAVSHEAVALRRRLRQADIPARNWLAVKAGGKVSTRGEAIKLTRGYMCDGQGYRALQVNGRCRNLIDEITSGYRNKEGADGFEDVPEDGDDHACDALGSWVWLRARR